MAERTDSAPPTAYLVRQLTRSLATTDGGTLVTIGDAYMYMTGIPEDRQLSETWQRIRQLMLKGVPPAELTDQLQIALFMDAKLDFRRTQ
jgi:hypothetical protein